jgi:hypothetical protein
VKTPDYRWEFGPTAPDTAALIDAAIAALAELGPRRETKPYGTLDYDPIAPEWQWSRDARAYCLLARALGVL